MKEDKWEKKCDLLKVVKQNRVFFFRVSSCTQSWTFFLCLEREFKHLLWIYNTMEIICEYWFTCVLSFSVCLFSLRAYKWITMPEIQNQPGLVHKGTHMAPWAATVNRAIKENPRSPRVTSEGSLSAGLYSCPSFCFYRKHTQSKLCTDRVLVTREINASWSYHATASRPLTMITHLNRKRTEAEEACWVAWPEVDISH